MFWKDRKSQSQAPPAVSLAMVLEQGNVFLFYIIMQVHSTMSPGPYLNTRMTPTTFSINNNCMDQ